MPSADLVFTNHPGQNMVVVHTTTMNASIFTSSDIYPIAYRDGKLIDSHHLIDDRGLLRMIEMGASLYRQAAPGAHSKQQVSR